MSASSGRVGRIAGRLPKLALGAVLGLALLALLRAFVGDVYRVSTGSMRPTLQAGDGEREYVLVTFGMPETLTRHSLVVVREHAGAEALVKRVVGLPGDEILLMDGDLLVDGSRLPPETPRAAPVPLFDSSRHALEEYFFHSLDGPAHWDLSGAAADLDALELERGSDAGLLFLHKPLLDDRLDTAGRRVPGRAHVGDAMLELGVRLGDLAPQGGRLRLRLLERGDTFEFVLDIGPEGRAATARLERRPGPDGTALEVLAEAPIELRSGQVLELRFANLDNHLIAAAPALGLRLRADYGQNRPWAGSFLTGSPSVGPRVAFGGEGLRARFEAVRVSRDLMWFDQGEYAVQNPLQLGPAEIFVLGDDSAASRDSRQFGPLPLTSLVGRPRLVVWPPGRVRLLEEPAGGWP
jgi:signal peptidase I